MITDWLQIDYRATNWLTLIYLPVKWLLKQGHT